MKDKILIHSRHSISCRFSKIKHTLKDWLLNKLVNVFIDLLMEIVRDWFEILKILLP